MDQRVTFENDDPVEVWDGHRWRRTHVDALPGETFSHGWVLVAGWPGRAGPVSVRAEHVRAIPSEGDK